MITKMTKYSFVLLSGEKEGFLEQLQELGLVDISRSVKPVDHDSNEMFEQANRTQKVIEYLESIDYTSDADADAIAKTTVDITGDPVDFAEDCRTKLSELVTALASAESQMKARLPWGNYDRQALEGLKEFGYNIHYYCIDVKKFDENWGSLYPLQVVENDGKKVWFVTIAPKTEGYEFPVQETAAPEGTAAESAAEIAQLKAQIIECKAGLLKAKDYIPAIKEARSRQLATLDRYLADDAGQRAAENLITVFTGFAPAENAEELTAAFDRMGVLYIKEDASQEDNPPIKLKNNWFARQFEVFTGMYGMPVYSEFDPTSVLAPFYLLFFAMCMGDSGYGIVLLLFGIALNLGWVKIGMFEGLGNIISILGVGTAVVGAALGTFFGMPILNLLSPESPLRGYFEFVGSNIHTPMGELPFQMLLALGIGIFHICLAMTIKAICYTKRFGIKENIATWGWLLLIVGGLIVALLGVGKVISAEAIKWAIIAVGGLSALAIYIFNTPGRNPLINIGAGLWDTYNMATGILGDVLSYIRLFALGLAGGMLGQAFNDLALMVKGENAFTWIPFILILLFGHILNVLMSALGSFVHPLRLTFVEYFKNAGYEGKGTKYNPLTTNKE